MALPPSMRRDQNHKIGKQGRLSETRLQRKLQARARPASGAIKGAKGDLDLGAFLLEAKSTTADSISVKLDWLLKIRDEARREGKRPALSLSFVDARGQPRRDGEYVLVRMADWQELCDGDVLGDTSP